MKSSDTEHDGKQTEMTYPPTYAPTPLPEVPRWEPPPNPFDVGPNSTVDELLKAYTLVRPQADYYRAQAEAAMTHCDEHMKRLSQIRDLLTTAIISEQGSPKPPAMSFAAHAEESPYLERPVGNPPGVMDDPSTWVLKDNHLDTEKEPEK